MMLQAFSQDHAKDTATYETKPLKIEEVHLVSSYYSQNGDHSAVTGGIGTEKVTDLANGLEIKWAGVDASNRKHTLTAGIGIDHHTSASSAYVNKSGASKTGGTRIYPSLNWNVENPKTGTGVGFGLYYSKEYNYTSIGLDAEFSKETNSNGEFSAKASGYFDKVKMIYPSEFVPAVTVTSASRGGEGGSDNIPTSPRTTGTISLSFSQIFTQSLQGAFLIDGVAQTGYLGLPFHRVYFANGTDNIENLPSTRNKLPIGFRLNYFLGDNIILRSYYRYYTDSWDLHSNTANLEVVYKITPFISVSPFYRFYQQTAAKYFGAYGTHTAADEYYTSNYALAAFTSQTYGGGIRIAPPGGIFKGLNGVELRYAHYTQTTDLVSDIISVDLRFK